MVDISELSEILNQDIEAEKARLDELIAQQRKLIDDKLNAVPLLDKCKVGNVVMNKKGLPTEYVIVGKAFIRTDKDNKTIIILPVCKNFYTKYFNGQIFVNRSGAVDYLSIGLQDFRSFNSEPFETYIRGNYSANKTYDDMLSYKEEVLRDIRKIEGNIEELKKDLYRSTERLRLVDNFITPKDDFSKVYSLMADGVLKQYKDYFSYVGDSTQAHLEESYDRDEHARGYVHKYE